MSNKMTVLIFTISVLLASFVVASLPQASALTPGTQFWNISSATLGNSKVCGDHVCKYGEKNQWIVGISNAQRISQGKLENAPHGENVMNNIANSTSSSSTMHGNVKMTESMNMTGSSGMPSKGMK